MSVMILNWNGKSYLGPCLDSVISDACAHVEVVVVDNGSTDDSISFVRDRYPRVQVVAHETNLGFSRSYDQAAPKTQGRYLVFLNNDTTVQAGWLGPLVDTLLKDPTVGITMCVQLFMASRSVITAGGQLKLWQGTSELGFGKDETFLGTRETTEPFFASGAAMAISRTLFDRLGGFDDHLGLYCEDLDLSWRARLIGYRVLCVTNSVIHHHISGTSGPYNPGKLRLSVSHNLAVMIKCLSFPNLIHAVPAYMAFTSVMAGVLAALERNGAYLTSLLSAFGDVLRDRRGVLARRRATQAQRVRSDRQVLQSDGFGLLDPPWVLIRNLRRGRRLSRLRRGGS